VPEQLPGEGNHHPAAAGRGKKFLISWFTDEPSALKIRLGMHNN
jgi:hypothetical protein